MLMTTALVMVFVVPTKQESRNPLPLTCMEKVSEDQWPHFLFVFLV